jgi:hypothetical protein
MTGLIVALAYALVMGLGGLGRRARRLPVVTRLSAEPSQGSVQ